MTGDAERPPRRDWVFITRAANWSICDHHHVFGFDAQYRETIHRYMKPGDRAIIYVASPIKGVVGVVHLEEIRLGQEQHMGWSDSKGSPKLFPDRVRWSWLKQFDSPIKVAKGSDYLNSVQWLPDKERWNVYLQVALIRACAEDVDLTLGWL